MNDKEEEPFSEWAKVLKARKAGTGELCTEPSRFDPFEALSPIQPVPVTSEKHLARELESSRIALSHESDWQGWVTALRKLAGLSMGVMMRDGTKLDLPQLFVSAVRGEGLHDAVAIRITDLRSAVCREACFVVACMANTLGGEIFAPLAETWLTAALRNATNAKEVMSASASAAVREIIRSASPGSPRLISILLDGMRAKAPSMRAQCAHGLCLALSHWEPKVLESANKQGCCATDVLAKALSDADQGVRARARIAYFICQRCIPAFSDTISANIHPSTKRHLLNDHAAEIEAKELVAAGCDGGERNNNGEQQRCFPNQPPLTTDLKTRMQQPTVSHVGRRRVGRRAMRAAAAALSDDNKHQQHNMNRHLPPQRVTTTKQQLRGGGGSVGHDFVPADGMPHTPAPAMRIRDKQQQQHVISSALRVVPGVNSGNVASREDTTVSRSSSNSLLSINAFGPQQAVSRSDSTDTATASVSNLNTGTSKRAFQQEVEKCLVGCGDKHWAVRRESLEQLQALLSSSSGKEIALEGHCGRKFLLRLGEACEDSNHLCALCGLELLYSLLPHVNHSSLGSLFPRVFVHLGSVKGGLRAAATAIIETARQSVEPAKLCAAICPRILDPPPEKARAAMVDFITGITPLAESHFRLPSNLRGYIARLATLFGSAGSGHSSVAAARKGLKALYCLDCEGVINAVATLPPATQKATKGVLAGFSEVIQQQKEKQEQEQHPVQEQLHIHLQPLQEKMSQQPSQQQSERQTRQQQKSPFRHGLPPPHMQTQDSQQPTEEGLPYLPEGTQQKQKHQQQQHVPCVRDKSSQQQPENQEQKSEKHTKQLPKMPSSGLRQPLSCITTYVQPQEVQPSHFQKCKDQASSMEKVPEKQQNQLSFNKKRMQSDKKQMLGACEKTALEICVESMLSGLCTNASTRERITALKALRLAATNGGVTFWKQYFAEVLTLLLDGAEGNKPYGDAGGDGVDENNPNPPCTTTTTTTTSKEEIHRSKLVQGIRCLISHQGSLFPPHTEFVVDHLLNFSTLTSSPLVRAESLAALRDLIDVLDSSRYMQCLLHRMHPRCSAAAEEEVGGPSYSNARNESLEILISLIPVLSLSVLLDTLRGSLLPGALEEAFDTKDDMAARQLAVKAYVVMYKPLGSALDMFMASMPVHRQKLIRIYINKDAAQSVTTEATT